jgi:hypothetical protein
MRHLAKPEGNQGARAMLSEIFILRLEAMLRVSNAFAIGRSDTRFVPIKHPVGPAKELQPAGKSA